MKKLILLLSFVLISTLGFSQATPTQVLRIANNTTAFDMNISTGKLVYDMNADELYVANTSIASTATLTSASGSFTLINPDDASTNLSEGTVSNTTVDVNSSTGTNATLQAVSTTRAGVMTKTLYDNVITNNAKVSNVSTELSIGTKTGTTMGITSDGGTDDVILPAATTNDAGLMTDAQFDKLAGIEAGADVNLTSSTEKFEETSSTATSHTLAHTAVTAQGCRVAINGATLGPADYTLTTSTITVGIPVVQYDIVIITYMF